MEKKLQEFNKSKQAAEKQLKIGGAIAIVGAAVFVLLGMSGIALIGLPMVLLHLYIW